MQCDWVLMFLHLISPLPLSIYKACNPQPTLVCGEPWDQHIRAPLCYPVMVLQGCVIEVSTFLLILSEVLFLLLWKITGHFLLCSCLNKTNPFLMEVKDPKEIYAGSPKDLVRKTRWLSHKIILISHKWCVCGTFWGGVEVAGTWLGVYEPQRQDLGFLLPG